MTTETKQPDGTVKGDGGERIYPFVAFVPTTVEVVDAKWQNRIGCEIAISGGVQVCATKQANDLLREYLKDFTMAAEENLNARVALFLDDPYMPPIEVHVTIGKMLTNFLPLSEDSPRKKQPRKRCVHSDSAPVPGCEACFFKYWQQVKDMEDATV